MLLMIVPASWPALLTGESWVRTEPRKSPGLSKADDMTDPVPPLLWRMQYYLSPLILATRAAIGSAAGAAVPAASAVLVRDKGWRD
jgi:hypothetical protein